MGLIPLEHIVAIQSIMLAS